MKFKNLPVLGFVAWSGTGKTTLLTKTIPLLKAMGIKIGVIKHVHHKFDIDIPGKDSYRLREAGATQVIAASNIRIAFMHELEDLNKEPSLQDALNTLQTDFLDIILIEGYKHEALPKIELHRTVLERPLLFPEDDNIIAIASDNPIQSATNIQQLDINDPQGIADFIKQYIEH